MFMDNLGRLQLAKKQFTFLCALVILCSVVWWVSLWPSWEMLHARTNVNFLFLNRANHNSSNITRQRQETVNFNNVSVYDSDISLSKKLKKSKPLILMWSDYYSIKKENLKLNRSCCSNVEISTNRNRLDEASAIVIFHYFSNLNKKDLPKTRRPEQLWVLFSKESPHHSPSLTPYNGLFNWTMSYRRDSEIWAPYGETVPKVTNKSDNGVNNTKAEIQIKGKSLTEWIAGKSKLIAGVISHCPTKSKREELIKRLRSEGGISIDIYGKCGNIPTCARNNPNCSHSEFWNKLSSQYKFYFAAENALCSDYITEKFWRGLELGMVPVAYGNGNYSAQAPPRSFIDTNDFSSPKKLANYLQKLDSDPQSKDYRKYFEWRRKFTVKKEEAWQGWCGLCKAIKEFRNKLDEDPSQLSKLTHVYKNLGDWWTRSPNGTNPDSFNKKQGACSSPKFL